MKKSAQKGNTFLIILISAAIIIGVAIFFALSSPKIANLTSPSSTPDSTQETSKNLKTYTSENLNIAFTYPKDWHVDEKDFDIMITSYGTKIGENVEPSDGQIKVFIDNFSGCHTSVEENLVDPACGEGGSSVPKNKIISKEEKKTTEAIFYKYVVDSPQGVKNTYHLLKNSDKVLQISKQPDPSQFEEEFNQIIDSIRFLP